MGEVVAVEMRQVNGLSHGQQAVTAAVEPPSPATWRLGMNLQQENKSSFFSSLAGRLVPSHAGGHPTMPVITLLPLPCALLAPKKRFLASLRPTASVGRSPDVCC